MKRFVFAFLLVLLTASFIACHQKMNDAGTARLMWLDSLLSLRPEKLYLIV